MTPATHGCSAERSDHTIARQFGLATWIIGLTSGAARMLLLLMMMMVMMATDEALCQQLFLCTFPSLAYYHNHLTVLSLTQGHPCTCTP